MTTPSDTEAIDRARDLGLSAFNARDVERFIDECIDDNAIFMPANEPPIVGKEAIRTSLQNLFDQYDVEQTVTSEEVIVSGDWAFNRLTVSVTLTPKAGGGPLRNLGKTIDIYRRQRDGSWKIARSISNSNLSLLSIAFARYGGDEVG